MFSQHAPSCCHGCPHVPVSSHGTLVLRVSSRYLWPLDAGDSGPSSFRFLLPRGTLAEPRFGYSDAGRDVDAGAGASERLLHGGGAAVLEAGGHLWLRWESGTLGELVRLAPELGGQGVAALDTEGVSGGRKFCLMI